MEEWTGLTVIFLAGVRDSALSSSIEVKASTERPHQTHGVQRQYRALWE